MPAQWTAEFVGKMHIHQITIRELANHMGISPAFCGKVLNGKREVRDAEQRYNAALDELIAARG